MGTLILSTQLTVVGVITVEDWFAAEGAHDAACRALFERSSAMVMGRKTYEGLAGFWPDQSGPWADLINPMPKFVASRTLAGPLEWNSSLIDGDAVAGVAQLKRREGDLAMVGCGDLARALVDGGAIDDSGSGRTRPCGARASGRSTAGRGSASSYSAPSGSTRASRCSGTARSPPRARARW